MKKIKITKEDKEEFKKTRNGAVKYLWCFIGAIIDILSTLGISLLIMYSTVFTLFAFYLILYVLLVIVVIGGEFIGTYYGALEQFVLNKKEKKELNYLDQD